MWELKRPAFNANTLEGSIRSLYRGLKPIPGTLQGAFFFAALPPVCQRSDYAEDLEVREKRFVRLKLPAKVSHRIISAKRIRNCRDEHVGTRAKRLDARSCETRRSVDEDHIEVR